MNKDINFYYLADPKTGGWVTYIIHMFRSLEKIGYTPKLFKIGKIFKTSTFFENIKINSVPIEYAFQINKKAKSIIIAMELKDDAMDNGRKLINNGCEIIHHGMGQTPKDDFFNSLNRMPLNYCVRKSIIDGLSKRNISAIHLRQPFLYENKIESFKKTKSAVSLSRVDFVKKTEIICEANEIEPLVDIYGTATGLYQSILTKKYPNWKKNHHGEFKPMQGAKISEPYKWLVDLTQIKNDGGEMQYTFMEAITKGCGLILNKKWDIPGGIFNQHNATFINTPEQLLQAIKTGSTKTHGHFDLLKPYSGITVAKRLVSTF